MTSADRTRDRTRPNWLALTIGVVYILVGVLGFFITGVGGFAAPDGELLLGVFEVNPLHNIVHIVIGLGGALMWNRVDQARLYGWLLAAGYGVTFVYGLLVAGTESARTPCP